MIPKNSANRLSSFLNALRKKPETTRRRKGEVRWAATSTQILEERTLLTANLAFEQIADGVQLTNAGGEPVVFANADSFEKANLVTFFSTNSGAQPVIFDGDVRVGDRVISGTFGLRESTDRTRVEILASGAGITFGANSGVRMSGADGAFVLSTSGLAGQVSVIDGATGPGLDAFGVKGLNLSTQSGVAYQINTTDANVDTTVSTANGPLELKFTDDPATHEILDQMSGVAKFSVQGASSNVADLTANFTMAQVGPSLVDLQAKGIRQGRI
jgi:hypothetical protein